MNVAYNSSTGQYQEYNDGYTENNGVIYWVPVSTATTINFTGTTVAGWVDSNTVPYSANKTDREETGHASIGNYYNWTAAIASNNSSSLTTSTHENIVNDPKNSICPKGWRLPTMSSQSASDIGSTNEFERLNVLYDNMLDSPLMFIKAGYINSSGLASFMASGIYTSSTVHAINAVWGGALDSYKFRIDWWQNVYGGRRGGWSTRCVAR